MAVNKTKKSFVKMKKIKAHLVDCRKTQKLDLSSLELTEIPEDFMNLVKAAGVTAITELDMHSNQLTELTNEFAEFRTLRYLKLSKNRFQGLPTVVLRFGKIQVLDLSENEIKEMDLGIQFLVSLRELNFSKNQLMMLPNFWSHLTLLVVLNLAKNRLMELPDSLGSLRSLQKLDVSENLLSSLPKAFQSLQELITFDAHGNHLTEVPPCLGLLKNLTEFDCSGNPFSDLIATFYYQGFEKFMDYLRNLHELQQLEELIRQKPEGQVVGSYKKYTTRYESGQRPLLRTGYSITQAGPITHIFGGRITNYVKVEEIYAIDSRTLLWVKLSTSGSMPTARDGHAAAFDGNKRLYVFGGRNEENKLLNDVYYLDIKTMTWFQPPVEGSIPSVREGASMAVIGSQLIVFGGRGSRQRYNDVHVLDIQVWTWTLQNTKGSIPAPRQNAAATFSGTKFYVHGGKGSLLLEDLHALDTVGFTWSREAIVCPYIALKENEEGELRKVKENHYPTQKIPKVTNTNYVHESSPVLNGEYLELQEHERGTQVTDFISKFKATFDRDLQMGENEEEDNLFLYCKERSLSQVPLEQTQGSQNIISISPENIASDSPAQGKGGIQSTKYDPFDRKRLHCWILVTTNKRDVPDCFFLEPSTGHRYTLQSSPYQAVEYIWNQHNIFINMQLNKDRSGIDTMSWDLKDTTKWERVLDTFLSTGDGQELIVASNTKSSTSVLSPGKKQDVYLPNLAPGLDTSRVESGPLSASTDKSTMKTGAILVSKEGMDKMPPEDPTKNGFIKPYHWLLPASWVSQLKIPMDAYVTRCPKGVKKTHYYRCTHELYSFYGDSVRWDGLIERIILYEDDERTNVFEIHDYFQRRKDCLRKRTFIPGLNKVHDFFDSGASFGLKETEITDGQSRKFLFYAESRNDGLRSREEVIGKTIVESFTNHEACLVYRCACYGPPLPPPRDEYSPKPLSERHLESSNAMHGGETSVKGSISRPGSVRLSSRPISHGRVSVDSQKGRSRSRMMSRWQGSSSNRRKNSTPTSSDKHNEKKLLPAPRRRPIAEKLLPIVKITQKYELRSDACPKDSVAKHVFKLSINQIKVDYHHVDRRITANSHVYNKDGSLNLIHADPFTPELTPFEKLDEFHSLVLAEREAIKSVRDTEREIEETLQQRLREEQNVVLITPYVDIACVKQDDLFQEGEDAIKLPTDYLSPFLPPGVRPRQKLTRQQMLDVRDSCLRALKERLVNRATIIQTRYDEETSHLSKRRANFERDREQMTVEDEETYNQDCENALFRIRILEFRAKQHEEEALKKYLELEKKLQNDPRLSRLYRASSLERDFGNRHSIT